jgi:hypothetical protein
MNDNIRFHCSLCEGSCNKCRLVNEYQLLTRYRTYEFELYEDDNRFKICHKGNSTGSLSITDAEDYLFNKGIRGVLFHELDAATGDAKQDKILKNMLHESIKRGLFYYFLRKRSIQLDAYKKEIIENSKEII